MRIAVCIVIAISVQFNLFACNCSLPPPPSAEFFAAYDLVFLGKVVSVKRVSDSDGDLDGVVALFSVSTWIVPKQHNTTISIYTSAEDGLCGRTFREGDTWLMATSYDKLGIIRSSICDASIQKNGLTDNSFDYHVEYFRKLSSFTGPLRETYRRGERMYTISGALKDGRSSGQWIKTAGIDTLAIWNFSEGRRHGYEMIRRDAQRKDLAAVKYYELNEDEMIVLNQQRQVIERYRVVNGVRHGKYRAYANDEVWLSLYYVYGRIEGQLVRWRLADENDRPLKTTYLFRNDRMIRKELVEDDAHVD